MRLTQPFLQIFSKLASYKLVGDGSSLIMRCQLFVTCVQLNSEVSVFNNLIPIEIVPTNEVSLLEDHGITPVRSHT